MSAFLSNDTKMREAYNTGKDLYAMIAQSAFNNEYWENLEFYPEGYKLEIDGKTVICGHKTHQNKDGKARRSVGKVLNLAATYGMGSATAGARLGKTKEEGEKLLDNFFTGFSGVKEAIDKSKEFLRTNGYVEDFVGRRRRLPEIGLTPYPVTLKNGQQSDFNPFLNCSNRSIKDPRVLKWEQKVTDKVMASQRVQKAKALSAGKDYEPNDEMSNQAYKALAKEALADGVIIHANTGRRAQASRQCFNARIQGSAASLTKMAMVDIFRDPQLRAWDAHLIITVHDEVLVECPEQFADLVEKRLPEIMVNAAAKAGDDVPQACDPYNVTRWYAETMAATLLDEYKKLEAGDAKLGILPLSHDDAFKAIIKNHSEIPEAAIIKTLETGCDLDF